MKRLLIVLMIAALALTVSVRQVNAADPPAGIRYAPPRSRRSACSGASAGSMRLGALAGGPVFLGEHW